MDDDRITVRRIAPSSKQHVRYTVLAFTGLGMLAGASAQSNVETAISTNPADALHDVAKAPESAAVDEVLPSDPSRCDTSNTDKYGEGIAWASSLDEALARGKHESKPVVVVFSALRQEPGRGPEHEY